MIRDPDRIYPGQVVRLPRRVIRRDGRLSAGWSGSLTTQGRMPRRSGPFRFCIPNKFASGRATR